MSEYPHAALQRAVPPECLLANMAARCNFSAGRGRRRRLFGLGALRLQSLRIQSCGAAAATTTRDYRLDRLAPGGQAFEHTGPHTYVG